MISIRTTLFHGVKGPFGHLSDSKRPIVSIVPGFGRRSNRRTREKSENWARMQTKYEVKARTLIEHTRSKPYHKRVYLVSDLTMKQYIGRHV